MNMSYLLRATCSYSNGADDWRWLTEQWLERLHCKSSQYLCSKQDNAAENLRPSLNRAL
jgi:hypothetical protein